MKTIGTCKECKWWIESEHSYGNKCSNQKLTDYDPEAQDDSLVYSYYESGEFLPRKDFGCVHWESNHQPTNPNYPVKDAKDLLIDDLKRENDAAFQRIQELSRALVDLGYDPTYKK